MNGTMAKSPFRDKRTLWEAEACDYAEEHGWEVRVTRFGVEFYDDDGIEQEYWDYFEPGAEERIRYCKCAGKPCCLR